MAGGINRWNSIDVREKDKVPKPDLTWEDGTYTLEHLLEKFELPRVIQCEEFKGRDVSPERSNFNFWQPMLLYQRRKCHKVMASSLDLKSASGTPSEIGNNLLIPDDYKGWFAVVNSKTISKPVPHYRSVEQLSQSDCHTFLIGGNEDIAAVQKLRKDNDPLTRVLYPGDVLRKGNAYIARTKVRTSIFSKTQIKEEHFLLCTDHTDREVLLPFTSKGVFYIVRNKSKKLSVPIMQMKDIVASGTFPCEVKLVFGRLPSTPCSFTGILALKNAYEESSIIASSIVNLRNILIELPVDIPVTFRVALTDVNLEDNKGYRDALLLCEEKAETYMRNIKVSQGNVDTEIADSTSRGNDAGEKTVTQPDSKSDSPLTTLSGQSDRVKATRPQPPEPQPGPPVPPRDPPTPKFKAPPMPPPQAFKPSMLDRVVSRQEPPPIVRVNQSPMPKPCKPKTQVYEQVWLSDSKTSSVPFPPKCPQSLNKGPKQWNRKSVNIGLGGGYLTVPVYPTQSPDDKASVPEKMNFWKCLDETSNAADQSQKSPQTKGKLPKRNESMNFSECGMSPVQPKRETSEAVGGRIVYENIEDLREVMGIKNKQSVYENASDFQEPIVFDNPNGEDVVYEPLSRMNKGDPIARDSGILADGMDSPSEDVPSDIVQLTVTDVYNKLKELGVKQKTCDLLLKEKVDGRLLVAFEPNLKAKYPFLSNMDQTKIGLLVRGFKPS